MCVHKTFKGGYGRIVNMKKFIIFLLIPIFLSGDQSDKPLKLWKDFYYGMSPYDVMEILKDFEYETEMRREKIGYKPKLSSARCAIRTQNIWHNSFRDTARVRWCFDAELNKKDLKTNKTNELLWIELSIDFNPYSVDGGLRKAMDLLDTKYKRIFFLSEILNDQEVENPKECERVLKNESKRIIYTSDSGLRITLDQEDSDTISLSYSRLDNYAKGMAKLCKSRLEKEKNISDI